MFVFQYAEGKDDRTLEDWIAFIAREESIGSSAEEHALFEEFMAWETKSRSAPNGKWRGANSRKWGKVGIEMRLTGSVPRSRGPVTALGCMVCKFVDIVDTDGCVSTDDCKDDTVVRHLTCVCRDNLSLSGVR
jgi:hypothetical protein